MMTTMMVTWQILFIFGITFQSTVYAKNFRVEESRSDVCAECGTELTKDDESLLFLTTLDGTFLGVDNRNGKILWQFKEEAAVKVPATTNNALTPMFLPDPKDGSLYMLNSENQSDLKKLQFTIQQLVSSSPCRSADGIFYTGKKVDSWFMVDWRTGAKEDLLNSETSNKICPLMDRNSMFIGRTEYNLIIHDITKKERKWNVTFYDYTAKVMPPEKIKNLENMYFAGSSTGRFAVLKNSGDGLYLWESDFGSPVIGVYTREGDGLVSLPFTTMDDSSMHLLADFNKRSQLFHHSSTLYIGEHSHGLYALPAITTAGTILLLNGPSSEQIISTSVTKEEETSALLGYYKMPDYKIERLQIAGRSDVIIEMNTTNNVYNSSSLKRALKTESVQTEEQSVPRYFFHQIIHLSIEYVLSPHNMEMKIFMLTMLMLMVLMFVYFSAQVREFKQSSSSGYIRQSNANLGIVTAIAEELPDGSTRVGKILFDPCDILGKGCEGTFVFKGEFDNRKVAVKRLLPECFTVADREVCLLRESDQHPNVIRYFCMEQDKQFRYIALELCSATLQEYTEKGILNDCITPSEALLQAVCGLEHLHSLHIVHRDIKPHNVLLSFPSLKENRVRAMISDFGLCKKLQTGKASFSRKSGITGTDGWIAPEIIHGKGRTTTAVDVFSMGCVFYYVLSKGNHPFGNSIHRQANIMNGEYNLDKISEDTYHLWTHLIGKMVTLDPSERPAINVVKNHPAFWTKERILMFLQDVSDRIEKEELTSRVLVELETGNSFVLTLPDWRDMIEQEIAEDLRKYRTYRHDSVRDLLRALRNKKHHYRELSDRVRDIFGSIPDKFVQYWLDRFPKLLLHTWLAMQCVNHEDVFQKYYCSAYTFPRIHDGITPIWIQHALNSSPRWRLPGRPLVSRFGNSSRSGPFASLYANGRVQEYTNWRQRNKITSDITSATGDCDVTEKVSLENEGVPVSDIDARSSVPVEIVEILDEDTSCPLQNESVVIGYDDQENVEPENEANDSSVEVQLKTGKMVRHRRGRNRNRKKLCDSGSMLAKSTLSAD